MAISPAAIKNHTGVCIETARKAIKELEIKGYIIWQDDMKYYFYEVPHKDIDRFGLESRKLDYLEVFE